MDTEAAWEFDFEIHPWCRCILENIWPAEIVIPGFHDRVYMRCANCKKMFSPEQMHARAQITVNHAGTLTYAMPDLYRSTFGFKTHTILYTGYGPAVNNRDEWLPEQIDNQLVHQVMLLDKNTPMKEFMQVRQEWLKNREALFPPPKFTWNPWRESP